MKDFNITKKWLNRFCFLSIMLFSVIVMCVVGTHITDKVKDATDIVALDFIESAEGDVKDELQRIYGII